MSVERALKLLGMLPRITLAIGTISAISQVTSQTLQAIQHKSEMYVPLEADFPVDRVSARYGYTPQDNSHVSIIILNYNGIEWTVPLVRSIYRKTSYPYEIIIIDNVSDEENQMKLEELTEEKLPIQLTVIFQSERTAVGRAWNEGIRRTKSKYVLLLNNDMLIIEDYWLTRLVRIAESDPRIGVVGCNLLFPDGKIQHVGGSPITQGIFHPHYGEPLDGRFNDVRDCDWVTGAALLIKREVIDKIGGFDHKRFYSGWEDVDYCLRAKLAGYRVVCAPVKIIHYESMTDKKLGLKKRGGEAFKEKWRWMLGGYPAWR